MIAHAKREAPYECCGILAGYVALAGVAPLAGHVALAGVGDIATEIYEMTNISSDDPRIADLKIPKDRKIRYMMDPDEQFQVMRNMRERNVAMLGIYHSHPHSEAYPSTTDIRLAFYPNVFYLIISLAEDTPSVRAFFIVDQKITEEKIERFENASD